MLRFAAWGLSTALVAGALATAGTAGDPVPAAPAEKPADKPWYNRIFSSSDKNPEPESGTFGATISRPPAIVAPLEPDVQAEALRAEQDAWQRRMDVCLKLREIALKTKDDALSIRADELERHATALYQARVQRLGVKVPRGSMNTLDRELGTGAAIDPLKVDPPVPSDTSKPALAQSRQFREVKP